jgi:predicted small lipoprotein YifL
VKRLAILALVALAAASALAACGKQGDLDRPGPMWGPRQRADAAEQARNAADVASNAAATNRAVPQQNPATLPYTDPGPIHDNPIPGAPRPNPSGNPTPGTPQ